MPIKMTGPASQVQGADGDDQKDALANRLLTAASEVFLERGFSGASVDEMAARAKASKITFYNHYGNKEKLFEAVVLRHSRKILDDFAIPLKAQLDCSPASLRRALEAFARRMMAILLTPENTSFIRVLHSEAERFPRFGEIFEEAGPQRGRKLIGDYLEKQMMAGVLRRADPELAAEQFMQLTIGELSRRLLLGLRPLPAKAEVETRIQSAVYVFLRAYGR